MISDVASYSESISAFLDLYSTSPTKDLGFPLSEIPNELSTREKCVYGAPYIAYQVQGKTYRVLQGSCHHWDCPKCGLGRAKTEYWRIVKGCETLSHEGKALYFVTVTTRGAGLSVTEAEQNYLQWTNRFLDNFRARTRREKGHWCYVQVTERQKRQHPHSHILITTCPSDVVPGCIEKWEDTGNGKKAYWQDALRSDYLQSAVCAAGLGEQYDISEVRSAAAVSRYVGKYLFKSSLHTLWPRGWRRVRYSQNWPKNEQPKTDAFVLLSNADWRGLAVKATFITTHDEETYLEVMTRTRMYDSVIIKPKKEAREDGR